MPTNTTSTAAALLTPEEVGALVIEPTVKLAVAADAAKVIHSPNSWFRVPVVNADPSAGWVNEGDEIPVTDATLDEIDVHFAKLAALSVVSNELAADSSPQAAEAIGQGLSRDLARKLDAAYFGSEAAPAPSGLASLAGVNVVDAGTAWSGVDPFLEAVSAADTLGTQVDAFVASPSDALALARLKQYDAAQSNVPLLSVDATAPTRRLIDGVPLLVSAGVRPGTVWGIPKSRCMIVIREDASVVADSSPFFSSDRTAIRGVMRCGFAYPQQPAISRITLSSAWAKTTDYQLNDLVTVSGDTLKATTAGTSGSTAPTAPAAVGGTVTDGSVTWTRVA